MAGERLEFRIRWGILTAARAALEVERLEDGTILLRATARTLPYLDAFYPVRDLLESRLAPGDLRVRSYGKRAKEGHGPARVESILFDSASGTAHLTRNGTAWPPIDVPPDVWDPLSSFYAYRALDLPADEPARLHVSDGKKVVAGTVKVLRRETVTTPAGTFDTVVIEPDIEGVGGIFKKSPGARVFIWLTDDGWRRPVRMQSEVAVGHFVAELTAVELGPVSLRSAAPH